MKIIATFLISIVLLWRVPVYSQRIESDQYLKAFEKRAQRIIALSDSLTPSIYGWAARLYGVGGNYRQADSIIKELLKTPGGDMFWMFGIVSASLHGKGKMSPETEQAVRRAWKTYPPYRGDTENHWCLYYSTLLLASQEWPGLPGSEWFNGKSSEENYNEAREYLIHWMKITTTIGQGEFDSPDYFPVFISPMILLAQFARESEMRTRGSMMADYLFADFAVDHLDGQYTGGSSRVAHTPPYEPLAANAAPLAYLYFGEGEPRVSDFTLVAALSSYRLPEIIFRIATDRSMPYVQKEKKRVRNVIRYGSEMNPPVYRYTYMTSDYALGSLQGGILQPIQQHTWGVNFKSGRPFTTIFGLHPNWSGRELGMFFPEEVKCLIANVVQSKSTYNNPDKWIGGSPFERTFQHKNSLIVLYDIPQGTTTDHIDGFFPNTLEKRLVDSSRWILCKAGDAYIGWYPLQEYEWKTENDCFRLRSHKLQNGYVIEVRSKSEIGSFKNFSDSLNKHIPQAVLQPGNISVRYVNLDGNSMEFTYPENRELDGKYVDLSQYKLFEGPYLNADVGSEKLTITYKNETRILDFKSLTITDR